MKMPNIRRIDFDLYGLPDYGPTRGRLSSGTALLAAMAMSDAAHALADFGFTRLEPQAKFIDGQAPLDLVLRMRASLREDQRAPNHSASSSTP
jgi:hypothetical protein